MTDREPPGGPAKIDWGRAMAEAVAIALNYAPRDAEELVHNAIVLVLEGTAPWDAGSTTSLAQHLVEVGLKARRNRRRSERRRRRPGVLGKLIAMFDKPPLTPEEELGKAHEKQKKARLFEGLIAELADDPDARRIALLEQEGVHEAQDQVDASGMSIENVRNARKRVSRRAAALAARDDEDEVES
jgi:DNA-directed RNA polymerase specialized sigma24 family protein